jgi:hypothetical protein
MMKSKDKDLYKDINTVHDFEIVKTFSLQTKISINILHLYIRNLI